MKWFVVSLFALVLAPFASFAACSDPSGNEGEVIYNSTAKMLQFCNGTVWVNAAGIAPGSGGGGGKPTYAGVTSATTDGTPNGGNYTKNLDALCASDFAGSRALRSSDMKYLYADITSADEAIVHSDDMTRYNNYFYNSENAQYLGTHPNCDNWSDNSSTSTTRMLTYQGSSGQTYGRTCNQSFKVHCVTD
jgi:hypothetical protein